MSENKTKPTPQSVDSFLTAVEPGGKREDVRKICEMMERLSGHKPKMWGSAIVGFGQYHYKYASGREGDHLLIGFSPRKTALTLYIMDGFPKYQDLMDRLGTYKTGKSCLYLKRLSDIDESVLEQLITESLAHMRETYDTA
jgi:hypothetical protein